MTRLISIVVAAAVVLTLLASWLVEPLLPELVPPQVGLVQLMAHALLLHDLLGMDALTVGAWYVAIDFQLFALLLLLMWGLRRLPMRRLTRQRVLPALVGALCAASLLQFNRMAELDAWALYFFGAYGLGALLFWCQAWPDRWRRLGLAGLAVLMALALALQFRERLVVAGVTAVVLALWQRGEGPAWLQARVQHVARHAYALFLIHFPICLLVNALYEHRAESPAPMLDAMAPLALLAAWALSNVAALPFYHWVEAPLLRWRPRAAALPSRMTAR